MFLKLDTDGGGTLSIDEITSMFAENGINMTQGEVADMFANAKRMDLAEKRQKQIHTGGSSNILIHDLKKKATEVNKKMEMSPDQFKTVYQSPASLRGKTLVANFVRGE